MFINFKLIEKANAVELIKIVRPFANISLKEVTTNINNPNWIFASFNGLEETEVDNSIACYKALTNSKILFVCHDEEGEELSLAILENIKKSHEIANKEVLFEADNEI